MTRWELPLIAGLTVSCSGATVTRPGAEQARLLLVAAGAPCFAGQQAIHAEAMAGVNAVRAKYGPLFGEPPPPLDNPSVKDLVDAVRRLPQEPSLVLYAGHGVLLQLDRDDALSDADLAELRRGKQDSFRLPSGIMASVTSQCSAAGGRCVSAVCLEDGWLTVNELVTAVPRTSEGSMIVMDSCASAHVDVRGATQPVAVLSGSPFSYPIQGNQTQLAAALATLDPARLDTDCSGWIEPREIFQRLARRLFDLDSSTAPKLRSQLPRPLKLLPAPKTESCQALLGPTPRTPGAHCSWEDGILQVQVHGPLTATTRGDAACDALPMPQSELWRSPLLIPVACTDDEGQCFRVQ